MTQYLNKSFTVAMPTGQQYRDNWDAIFGKKESEQDNLDDIQLEDMKQPPSFYYCDGCNVCDRMFRTKLEE